MAGIGPAVSRLCGYVKEASCKHLLKKMHAHTPHASTFTPSDTHTLILYFLLIEFFSNYSLLIFSKSLGTFVELHLCQGNSVGTLGWESNYGI